MGRQPSVMSHDFSMIPSADIPRSQFNRSSGFKTTFDSGYLVPIYCDEVLPGDTHNIRASIFARLATPQTPILDNLFADTFWFFVPTRLLWNNFQRMMGERTPDPDSSIDFLVPVMTPPTSVGYTNGSLQDYFGLPTLVPNAGGNSWDHVSLPFRAYNLIWNEWFRSEDLQDSVTVDLDDGPDDPANYVLLRRGKRHDYFTSCLPQPQKGVASSIIFTGQIPVKGIGAGSQSHSGSASPTVWETLGSPAGTTFNPFNRIGGTGDPGNMAFYVKLDGASGSAQPAIYADAGQAGIGFTVNALREAFQVQRLLERDARGGTRYTEILRAHFRVISPDARLQRPEYLGGNSTPININPIAQTSPASTDPDIAVETPQGNLAAVGTLNSQGSGFVKSFVEHGYIIGLISVRADLTYQQGLHRMWTRRERLDYYWPAFSHLGEQPVYQKEIYLTGTPGPSADDKVFGYQERSAEYRYKPSIITGKFRSNDPASLDYWHLSQEFGSAPELNDEFIIDEPPVQRVIAVPGEPEFLLDAYFRTISARPMPMYAVPGFIDHF